MDKKIELSEVFENSTEHRENNLTENRSDDYYDLFNHKEKKKFQISINYILKKLIQHKKLLGFFLFLTIFIFIIVKIVSLNVDLNLPCEYLEPMTIYKNVLNTTNKDIICQNEKTNSEQICYFNRFPHLRSINTPICIHKNLIMDTTKWQSYNLTYNGPVNKKNRSSPLLFNDFYNLKCNNENRNIIYNDIYNFYFENFNYNNEITYDEIIGKNKTIFLINRDQDSPNLYHGFLEFISAFTIMNILKINPENVQILFLESMNFPKDIFYDFYAKLISRGGKPLFLKNLSETKKKYLIENSVNVPISIDSPFFMVDNIVVPKCSYESLVIKNLRENVFKYMDIPEFHDLLTETEIIQYPKSYNSSKKYTKFITIQNRQVYPKTRKGQFRVLGNGRELLEGLSKVVKPNVLVRLVDTGRITITEQIGLMQKTDYFIGVHGAGLMLILFAKKNTILHEIRKSEENKLLLYMGAFSNHKLYSDYVKNKIINEDNEFVYFNVDKFVKIIKKRMEENGF